MKQDEYREYLMSRIFINHTYESSDHLLLAIEQANQRMDFNDRKQAFNAIGERVVMRDGRGYSLRLEDVPSFIRQEVEALVVWENRNMAPPASGAKRRRVSQ
ncbi:hypothetical protein [Thiolapillus sp.]|uniref:hypothetical protein n=1 Tax=Thiolapillus sp. TaxID=2017437 RepID=UPI0025DAEC0C|nr:hypothetical protein [Thiolapillus sp.]